MQNLVDHNGRTIWFSGPPGPMKPTNSKSRGKRTSKKENQLETDDHDYSPKKAKKAENGTKKAANASKKAPNASKKAANGSVKAEINSVEADIQSVRTENGTQKATKVSKKKPTKSPKPAKVANPSGRVTRSTSRD